MRGRKDRREAAEEREAPGERSLFRWAFARFTAGRAGAIVVASRQEGSTVAAPHGWEFATPQESIRL